MSVFVSVEHSLKESSRRSNHPGVSSEVAGVAKWRIIGSPIERLTVAIEESVAAIISVDRSAKDAPAVTSYEVR